MFPEVPPNVYRQKPQIGWYWDALERGTRVYVGFDYDWSSFPGLNIYVSVLRACAWMRIPMSDDWYGRIIPKGYEDKLTTFSASRRASNAIHNPRRRGRIQMTSKEFEAFWKECKRQRDERPLRWLKDRDAAN